MFKIFEQCSGLNSIVVDNGNSIYDSRENCNAIIETAKNYLIQGCNSTIIPNSVTSIGDHAFYGCSGLTSITIPNSVTSMGRDAFGGCTELNSIVVENGNPNYDTRDNCNAIIETATNTLILGCKSTIIPNSVTTIGEEAFSGCSGLSSINIPNSVTNIGSSAFRGCSGLTSVTIPNSVTNIGGWAFQECSSLTSIVIPNSVTRISRETFENCTDLTSVIIGNSVTSIWDSAFLNCTSLSSITSLNPTPPNCYNRLGGFYPFTTFTAILYVPKGSILQYKAADVWRNFVIIREIADEDNDIHLTINDGAHGSMMLKVNDANPFFSFKLKAESGWSVYSLTLNGEDVTAEMAADGSYTTPAINSNSTLNIVYSQGGTSVAALNSAKYMLSAQDGSLLISGTEGGERITVYTLDGKNVASATAQYGLNEVAVPANQTYIVKIDQQSFKVVVK